MPEPRTIYFGAADDKGLLFGRSRSRLPGRRRSPIRFDCSRTSSPPAPMAGCYSKRDRTQGANASISLPATVSPVANLPTTGIITTRACMTTR